MITQFQIDDLPVEVVRKAIRTLRVTVYPPDGRVRVTAPLRLPVDTIQRFVRERQDWIRKHQQRIAALPQPAERTYRTGELHPYQGRQYQLRVYSTNGRAQVVLSEDAYLNLYVPEGSSAAEREQVLTAWYRARLKEQVPGLLAKWEPVVGAQAASWGVKQMKTRWGTCNIRARRIWLSLELIKKPLPCLEYVVVHELVHLHERLHNARFWGLMSQYMPDWAQHKTTLNQAAPGVEVPRGPDAC